MTRQTQKNNTDTIAGPAWDLSSEYGSLDAPSVEEDLQRAIGLIERVEALGKQISPLVPRAEQLTEVETKQAVAWAQEAAKQREAAEVLLWNVSTFVNCELSCDAKNEKGKKLLSRVQPLSARLAGAASPFSLYLQHASDAAAEAYLAAPHTKAERFALMQERHLKVFSLSLKEEELAIELSVNGPTAWGTLYDNLSGSIAVDLGDRQVGLAEASSLSQSEDAAVRQHAFRGIARAWEAHEESAAAILNALAGWRLDLYRRRSHTKPMHFLESPLHSSRIKRETLDAMMTAVAEARPSAQKGLKLQAKALGKDKLDPWDLFVPCPAKLVGDSWTKPDFARAVSMIAESFGRVDPSMGDFVRMMADRQWIEGRVGPTKRPGAYCTGFPKSRTPRVYMTYTGGMREFKTLAHELGHALHSWVMKDLPLVETHYPMTLAETASIFGETVVNGAMLEVASPGAKLNVLWSQVREAEGFLLNIPARFEFEKQFYEKRQSSQLSAGDLKVLMGDAWRASYGDTLTEVDPMFWANKLHFSIAELSFYNFPYTFGYLFALGVYAQRAKLGDKFYPAYVALLRDTGRMTAEEVARRHLGADLTKPDFWRESVNMAGASVSKFEQALKEAGVKV